MHDQSNINPRSAQAEPDAPPLEYTPMLARLVHHELAGTGLLLLAALAAFVIANSAWSEEYHRLWSTPFGLAFGDWNLIKDLHLWVNDGLMAIFFFMVGLEIKRELLAGELVSFRRAMLPAVGAIGGMAVPAIIYWTINADGAGRAGWGIPMATDIAFAAGCLAIMKNRVPSGLIIFLVALAIVDDLGAVAVIAIFYTDGIALESLAVGACLISLSYLLGRVGIRSARVYVLTGFFVWLAFLRSGVHATVAGVLLAFTIPVNARYKTSLFAGRINELLNRFVRAESEWPDPPKGELIESRLSRDVYVNGRQQSIIRAMNVECHHVEAPLQRIEYNLEPLCVFVILPAFAFVNAGVHLEWSALGETLTAPVTLGSALGLVLGKPIGIFVASYVAVRLGLASLPTGVGWPQIFAVGVLAGVGFTMSLFINEMAFAGLAPDIAARFATEGKIGIFLGSIAAAVSGLVALWLTSSRRN